ncbi:hypothetical protein YB2330_005832 [Saitoella coloradoensis]
MTTYFATTLSRAAHFNKSNPHNIHSLNHLLTSRSHSDPNLPVLGIPVPSSSPNCKSKSPPWTVETYTWLNLLRASTSLAHTLHSESNLPIRIRKTTEMNVGLLCPSNVEFVVVWLSCMRLGLAPVLIAPQCSPEAIAGLLRQTNATHLLYHPCYAALAQSALAINDIVGVQIPAPTTWKTRMEKEVEPTEMALSPEEESKTTAFYFHTSGTTTGLPSPIKHLHAWSTVVQPYLPYSGSISTKGGEEETPVRAPAVFTTTPLYHGGTADLTRSMMSDAMLWLFPADILPITAHNISQCVSTIQSSHTRAQDARMRIGYFSAVPYVLQLLWDAGPEARSMLASMDLVSFGGAPLAADLGSAITRSGVNLISKYGSAECGFLLCSHRDDDAFLHPQNGEGEGWAYVRLDPAHEGRYLHMEKRHDDDDDDGRYELIVAPSYPQLGKVNRADGGYATADLYEPHPTVRDAWLHVGRADSVVALVSGKKFEPGVVEDAVRRAFGKEGKGMVSDVVVFGVGRVCPGVLIVPAEDSDGEGRVWEMVRRAMESEGVPKHARVGGEELVVVLNPAADIAKSSKGTLLRPQIWKRYEKDIEDAYARFEGRSGHAGDAETVTDADLLGWVRDVVMSGVGKENQVGDDTDLFAFGVDSITATRLRAQLLRGTGEGVTLGMNVVYDHPSIKKLTEHILKLRRGEEGVEGKEQVMLEMVEKYGGGFLALHQAGDEGEDADADVDGEVVVVTGATGALGAHVVSLLLSNASVRKVVCLVRASSTLNALERVRASLKARKINISDEDHKRLECLPAKLGEKDLGLCADGYEKLRKEATCIIHAAWAVNFVAALESFERDHIAGARNLIDLCLSSPKKQVSKFFFCSSGCTVLSGDVPSTIPECVVEHPSSAGSMGYAQSKWVTERVCAAAHSSSSLRNRIGILRLGQLSADTREGVWNEQEAIPLMFKSVDAVGALPALEEGCAWLPIDIAARAIVEIALGFGRRTCHDEESVPVWHITNAHTETRWRDVLGWFESWLAEHNRTLEIIDPASWVQRLADSNPDESVNPSRKLLGMWQAAYCNGDNAAKDQGSQEPPFEVTNAERDSEAMRAVGRVGEEVMKRTFESWAESGFLRV